MREILIKELCDAVAEGQPESRVFVHDIHSLTIIRGEILKELEKRGHKVEFHGGFRFLVDGFALIHLFYGILPEDEDPQLLGMEPCCGDFIDEYFLKKEGLEWTA